MKKSRTFRSGVVRLAIAVIGLNLFWAQPLLRAENQTQPNTSMKIPTESVLQNNLEVNIATNTEVKTEADIEEKSIDQSKRPNTDSESPGKMGGNFPSGLSSPWVALVVVLGIILVATWTLRKAWPGANTLFGSLPVLQVLGRTHLSPKQTLALIKLDNKLLLIGLTDHQISPLMTLENPEDISRVLSQIEQTRTAGITGGFRNLFSHENQTFRDENTPPIALYEDSSDKNGENGVLELKTELNTLLKKVRKLKGNGGKDLSL
jgi:flagellar biogenesis protein FliO